MKKLCAALLCAAVFVSMSPRACGEGGPAIEAPSAVLMTLEGQPLAAKDAHAKRAPASVTKVMTLLLVCEAIDSGAVAMSDTVTASAHAASMGGSQIWLEEGEQMTVEEMIKCVAVASANDCAVALGEHLAGSEAAFVEQMNDRAAQLGMEDTHFVNCCGLSAEGHLTSAWDIGLMSAQLLREHPWITDYTTIWQDTVRQGAFGLNNTNKMLKSDRSITGLKTGFTSQAGYCISASAQREDLTLIAVVMGGKTSESRNADAAALLNWGFAGYAAVTLGADRPLAPIPVKLGEQAQVSCRLAEAPAAVLPKGWLNDLEKDIELAESLLAPVEAGQQVGRMTVRHGEETVTVIPIVAGERVERMGLFSLFLALLKRTVMKI